MLAAHPFFSVAVLGTVGQWLSGLGTIVALSALVRIIRTERRRTLKEQVTNLHAWFEKERGTETIIYISNNSASMISEVRLMAWYSKLGRKGKPLNRGNFGMSFGPIDNNDYIDDITRDRSLRFISPGITVRTSCTDGILKDLVSDGFSIHLLHLECIDSGGMEWRIAAPMRGRRTYEYLTRAPWWGALNDTYGWFLRRLGLKTRESRRLASQDRYMHYKRAR